MNSTHTAHDDVVRTLDEPRDEFLSVDPTPNMQLDDEIFDPEITYVSLRFVGSISNSGARWLHSAEMSLRSYSFEHSVQATLR